MRSRRWKGLNHFHLLDLIHQEDGNEHDKNHSSQNEKFYEAKKFFFIKSTNFYLPFYVKPRVHKALKLKIKKINFWSLVIRFFWEFLLLLIMLLFAQWSQGDAIGDISEFLLPNKTNGFIPSLLLWSIKSIAKFDSPLK